MDVGEDALAAIAGASRTLARLRPSLLLHGLARRRGEALAWLAGALGYACAGVRSPGLGDVFCYHRQRLRSSGRRIQAALAAWTTEEGACGLGACRLEPMLVEAQQTQGCFCRMGQYGKVTLGTPMQLARTPPASVSVTRRARCTRLRQNPKHAGLFQWRRARPEYMR